MVGTAGQCLLVFTVAVLLDIVWARYTRALTDMRRLEASAWSFMIIIGGGVQVVNYVHNRWLLIPAALGAAVGTYIGLHKK